MKKRGSGNIIIAIVLANVLFIALIIILLVLARTHIEKELGKVESKISAISNLNIHIFQASLEQDKLLVSIKNIGAQEISGMIVRITSADNEEFKVELPETLAGGETKTLEFEQVFGKNISNYKSIEITPKYILNNKEETAGIKKKTASIGGGGGGGSGSGGEEGSSGGGETGRRNNNPGGGNSEEEKSKTIVQTSGSRIPVAGQGVNAVIIIPNGYASSNLGYEGAHIALQRYIQQITGTTIPIKQVSTAGDLNQYNSIFWIDNSLSQVNSAIGTELSFMDEEGFIIKKDGKNIYLSGRSYWGTTWAAYDFLERFANIGVYGPTYPNTNGIGLFEYIPKSSTILMYNSTYIKSEPSYTSRAFSGGEEYLPKQFRTIRRDAFHHNLINIFNPNKYGDSRFANSGQYIEYREYYYPLILLPNGNYHLWVPSPSDPDNFQPRIADPRVVDLAVQSAIEAFQSGKDSFSLGVNDHGNFCDWSAEELSKNAPSFIDTIEEKRAYSMLKFYNQVAQKLREAGYGNKKIGFLLYAGIQSLPEDSITLDSMLIPYLVTDSGQLYDMTENQKFYAETNRWDKMGSRLGIYEYMYGYGYIIPRIYNKYLAENIKNRYYANVTSFYAEVYPNWGLDGSKLWLTSKLLWDNTLNENELLDKYYTNLFGPGKQQMKQYFEFLENTWYSNTNPLPNSNYPFSTFRGDQSKIQLEIFNLEKCSTAKSYLSSAKTNIDTALQTSAGYEREMHQKELDRVNYFEKSIALSCLFSLNYDTSKNLNKSRGSFNVEIPLAEEYLENSNSISASYSELANLKTPIFIGLSSTLDILNSLLTSSGEILKTLYNNSASITEEAIKSGKTSLPELRNKIDSVLSSKISGISGASNFNIIKNISEIAKSRTLFYIKYNPNAPVLDGNIDYSEWGEPIFDGYFYQVYTLTPSRYRTKIYAMENESKLFLAFDLEANSSVMGADILKDDGDTGVYPAMQTDDSVGINFGPVAGNYLEQIRFNIRGFKSDMRSSSTAYPYEVVKVRITNNSNSWMAEVEIDYKNTLLKNSANRDAISISRYTRSPDVAGRWFSGNLIYVETSTLVPVANIGGNIGQGNCDICMFYVWGSRPYFERNGN